MATITQCDKCNKIISKAERESLLDKQQFFRKGGEIECFSHIDSGIDLCPKCLKEVYKFIFNKELP